MWKTKINKRNENVVFTEGKYKIEAQKDGYGEYTNDLPPYFGYHVNVFHGNTQIGHRFCLTAKGARRAVEYFKENKDKPYQKEKNRTPRRHEELNEIAKARERE